MVTVTIRKATGGALLFEKAVPNIRKDRTSCRGNRKGDTPGVVTEVGAVTGLPALLW